MSVEFIHFANAKSTLSHCPAEHEAKKEIPSSENHIKFSVRKWTTNRLSE